MPLPLILGIGAAILGATGIGTGIHGAVKMKDANDTIKSAKSKHDRLQKKFEDANVATSMSMDKLGNKELNILKSFDTFSRIFELIHNKPEINKDILEKFNLPSYNLGNIKDVSVGAGVLLGGLTGAGLGAAGGFAAAGATTSAVMALGTASTGTAIASLSGVAATNATLAALGGGALAAGGGGMALGSTILGVSTLGVGLLVGGIIFNFTGNKISDKADEAWHQVNEEEKKVNEICSYLNNLKKYADTYYDELVIVNEKYQLYIDKLNSIVKVFGHTNWNTFTDYEKMVTDNTILLVGLLHEMCKVKLVVKKDNKEINQVNTKDITEMIEKEKTIRREKF